jgi:RNA polymerase sigma factor (sigma-70 family)
MKLLRACLALDGSSEHLLCCKLGARFSVNGCGSRRPFLNYLTESCDNEGESKCITGVCLRSLDWSPRELRRKARTVEQAIQLLTAPFHRSPTDIEIAQKLNIPLLAYQQLLGELKGLEIGSLNSERSEDSGEDELDVIPGRPDDDPLFRYLDGEMRERLTMAINDLPERERLVMSLYYYEDTTMKEIGIILGVVESRVSQIHPSAILHLRARLAMPTTLKQPQNKPAGDHSERARGGKAGQRIAAHSS